MDGGRRTPRYYKSSLDPSCKVNDKMDLSLISTYRVLIFLHYTLNGINLMKQIPSILSPAVTLEDFSYMAV